MKVTALPDESQMLSVEGYHLHIAGPNHEGWELYLYHQVEGGFMQHRLGRIVKPRLSSWGYQYATQTKHVFNWVMPHEMGSQTLRAMSESLYHIAKLIEAADEGIKDQIAAVERARAEREEEQRKRREEFEAQQQAQRKRREEFEAQQQAQRQRVAEIYELVRWLEGQKFRLTREGYRATVFGTIERVTEQRMYTISEKNVPMIIEFRDLSKLEIKYEDEKRYTLIYERKEEPAHA